MGRGEFVAVEIDDLQVDVSNSIGGEEVVEVVGVGDGHGDVLAVVEEHDVLGAARLPSVAEVVALEGLEEAPREGRGGVGDRGGGVLEDGEGADLGVDFLAGVAFAVDPVVDVAEHGLGEDLLVGYAEAEELVVGEQDADGGAGHAGNGGVDELAVGLGDVVAAGSGEGVGEVDVGVLLRHEAQHGHGGLAALRVAGVEEGGVPAVAHGGQQLAGGEEGVDAGLGVDGGDAVGLVVVVGDAEAVVVGRHGDESAGGHARLHVQFAARGALVGAVDGEVIVEQHAAGRGLACDGAGEGDGAGEHDGVAVGVGGGVDEVVDLQARGAEGGGVGDVGLGKGQVGGRGLGFVVLAAGVEGQERGYEDERQADGFLVEEAVDRALFLLDGL